MMLLIPGPRLLLLLGFLLQFQLAISPFALFYFILFHYFCRFSLPLSVFVCWRRMLALLFSIFYFPFSAFPFRFWPCLFVSAGAPLWFPLIYFRFQVISASTQHFMAVFARFWSFTFFWRFSCCISSKTPSANICHLRVWSPGFSSWFPFALLPGF